MFSCICLLTVVVSHYVLLYVWFCLFCSRVIISENMTKIWQRFCLFCFFLNPFISQVLVWFGLFFSGLLQDHSLTVLVVALCSHSLYGFMVWWNNFCFVFQVHQPLLRPQLCCRGGHIWKGLQNHHQLCPQNWKSRGGAISFTWLQYVRTTLHVLIFSPSLSRSCVSTTSSTPWRVSTRSVATAELPSAGSGSTEAKHENDKSKHIPCYSV